MIRKPIANLILFLIGGLLLCSACNADDPEIDRRTFEKTVVPFFKKHCYSCHGPKSQNAERRFDKLSFPIANGDQLIDFQDALDQLNLGEMPPHDEPQPEQKTKASVISWLTLALKQSRERKLTTRSRETVLRRLNRREYRHTIEDLLGIDTRGFDPTIEFPADQTLHHLDNQGDVLVTSGFLLNKYLTSAHQVIEKAIPSLEQPKTREWFFENHFLQQPELDSRRIRIETGLARDNNINVSKNELPTTIRIYENPRAHRHMGAYGLIWDFRKGVPFDGNYELTIELEALHRQRKHKENYSRIRQNELMEFAIVPGDLSYSALHVPQPLEPELFRTTLKDGRQTIRTTVWLHQGTTPRFTWPNGSPEMRSAHIKLGRELFERDGKKKTAPEEALIRGMATAELPHIRIHSVKIRGPIWEQWPSDHQRQIFGDDDFDEALIPKYLHEFMQRAFRRPILPNEVDPILTVINQRKSKGAPALTAFRDGLKAVLCSPGFLYLDEPTDSQGRLTQFAVASRLSYFLWSSMPDEELLSLAKKGKLVTKDELNNQVDRMLADPKSDRFVSGFLDSWLTIGNLGQTPPDNKRFSAYYQDDLERAMERETFLFTRHLLDANLSIDNFLDSDFTFANARLADLYGLESDQLDGSGFQMIDIRNQAQRGGLLGQASLLTVSANGVDTSPVVRGVWILENLLGMPPSPPPPDVEPLDPDIRGAKSIRDQLEKHRRDSACTSCHRKIDPLGFGLENYDAIGRWRTHYKGGKGRKRIPIDASGVLANGERFDGIEQFRNGLLKQKQAFAKALVEKMMAYALGRQVDIHDRPQVDSILSQLDENGNSMRFLIKQIVASDSFIRP